MAHGPMVVSRCGCVGIYAGPKRVRLSGLDFKNRNSKTNKFSRFSVTSNLMVYIYGALNIDKNTNYTVCL